MGWVSMSRFTYKITNMVLEVWDKENPNENNAPFLRQGEWPDGTAWENEAQITDWAEAAIAALENPDSEMMAGPNPENPVIPRPIIEIPSPDKTV